MIIANLVGVAARSHYTVLAPLRSKIFRLQVTNYGVVEVPAPLIRRVADYLQKDVEKFLRGELYSISSRGSDSIIVPCPWETKEKISALDCSMRWLSVTVKSDTSESGESTGHVRLLEFNDFSIIVTNNPLRQANARASIHLEIFKETGSYEGVTNCLEAMFGSGKVVNVQNIMERAMTEAERQKQRVQGEWLTALTSPLAGLTHERYIGWGGS